MNSIISALAVSFVSVVSTGSLIGLLIWVAIAAVVISAIIALVKWSGIAIPQPVWIVLWAFIAIALFLFIARMFGLVAP